MLGSQQKELRLSWHTLPLINFDLQRMNPKLLLHAMQEITQELSY